MKVAKSDAKAPETNKVNEVKMEPVILLDSEEERVDPSRGSKDGGNPCYSRRGKVHLFINLVCLNCFQLI